MIEIPARCVEDNVSHKKISLNDPGTGEALIIENNKRLQFQKIKVDIENCVPIKGRACDWLLRSKSIDFYVELGGNDKVKDGCEQILNTVRHIGNRTNKLIGLVVHGRNPIEASDMQILRATFKEKHGITLYTRKRGQPFQIS